MKIGDKVRFLNDVGGGTISGFRDRDIVLVRDADGFDVPTQRSDVVVIETDHYNLTKEQKAIHKPQSQAPQGKDGASSIPMKPSSAGNHPSGEEKEKDPADPIVSFRPKALERRGAEELEIYLAFLPLDPKQMTTTNFEAYLVNDGNFFVRFSLLTVQGKACTLRHEGEIPPNTKIFLEEFSREKIEEWSRLIIQLMAFKRDKSFLPKAPLSVSLRIEGIKFYKLHAFVPSVFFNEPALVFDVVRHDRPVRSILVDPSSLREKCPEPLSFVWEKESQEAIHSSRRPAGKRVDANGLIEVDLHASALLDEVSGLQPKDILDLQIRTFHQTMKAHLKEKARRIVFIHGKGDGILRNALLSELKRNYPKCLAQDASFQNYGFGATMVTIY